MPMGKIKYLHHSFFKISFPECSILIDPFSDLPEKSNQKPLTKAAYNKSDLKDIKAILVSHEHFDHFDKKFIEELVEKNNAGVIAYDSILSELNIKHHCKYPICAEKKLSISGMGIEAFHVHHPGSFYPLGFRIECNGFSAIHMGDTFLMDSFSKLKADIVMVPIGGGMTMDITDAVRVIKNIEPKKAIPMHYNTFEMIKTRPQEFKERIENSVLETKAEVIKPGKTVKF